MSTLGKPRFASDEYSRGRQHPPVVILADPHVGTVLNLDTSLGRQSHFLQPHGIKRAQGAGSSGATAVPESAEQHSEL